MFVDAVEVPSYEVPYENVVPSNPTLEDMKQKVVVERVRPPLDKSWQEDEVRKQSIS